MTGLLVIVLWHVEEELGRIIEHQKLQLHMVRFNVRKKLFLLRKAVTCIIVQVKSPPVIRGCTLKYFKIFDCVALMWQFSFLQVHCEWDDWMIGDCSRTCAGGWRIKSRTPKVSAEYGGDNCTGPSSVEESCNLQNCPSMRD